MDQAEVENTLLTTAEAAARLGVTSQTITRWLNRGILEGIALPIGSRHWYRFRESQIDTLIMLADRAGQDVSSMAFLKNWHMYRRMFRE